MATLTPSPRMQFFDANGNPLVGGKLYTYLAGTTTPLATYTNSGAGTPNANPVILDSRGEASVWLGTSLYYMELKTSADVLVWTSDNIGGVATLSALAASGGSALIGFIQSGAGAVARTVQSKLSESVSVTDFGAVSGGAASTNRAAFQAAIDYAAQNHMVVLVPAGTYAIDSTLTIYNGTQIAGDTGFAYGAGYSRAPKATTISFNPAVNSNLFNVTWFNEISPPTFKFHISVSGLYIVGNANANQALNLDGVIYSRFENMAIDGFATAIRCNGTINNRFCNIMLNGATTSCVAYAGAAETTDVWEQCSFFSSPTGVAFAGASVGIRFNKCLWEQISNYGVDIARECNGIMVTDAYCEDVPYATSATSAAMFRVGYTGATTSITNHLIVNGGFFSGRSAGITGSLFDINYCNGVIAGGFYVARFVNVFRINATNCLAHCVTLSSYLSLSCTNNIVNETGTPSTAKIAGVYANGVINSGTLQQNAYFGTITADYASQFNGALTVNGLFSLINSSSTGYNDNSSDGTISSTWRRSVQKTTAITTAKAIINDATVGLSSASCSYVKVFGSNNAGNSFFDTLIANVSTSTITVQSSTTVAGTPAARTYAISGFQLTLAMASGTYNANTIVEVAGYPF